MDFLHATPGRLANGRGSAFDGTLARHCTKFGARAILVCGTALVSNGTIGRIAATLEAQGISVVVHGGVPPEPTLDHCREAIDAARSADMVLGIGGGSVLDVAKAAALAPFDTDPAEWFHGRSVVPDAGALPMIAVPTTAGTGSEATWVGVYTDSGSHIKASFRGGSMMPSLVVLDPLLGLSCPASVTAWSGLDAFVQSVEAWTSKGANPLTDALALSAARDIAHWLPVAIADGEDVDAREHLLLASCMAGIALNTARLGLVHGLAHPLGAATGAAHGLLCGMLLPAVARWNANHVEDRYDRLAVSLGSGNMTAPERIASFVLDQLTRTGSPIRLRELDLAPGNLADIARGSLASGSTAANPRTVDFEGALEVLQSAW